ncbi:tyrosine-protein phosphatase siw14 [Tilletia horrida]|nr:tyrosine-protein phosphatase siw14 [Tilletia horrida]
MSNPQFAGGSSGTAVAAGGAGGGWAGASNSGSSLGGGSMSRTQSQTRSQTHSRQTSGSSAAMYHQSPYYGSSSSSSAAGAQYSFQSSTSTPLGGSGFLPPLTPKSASKQAQQQASSSHQRDLIAIPPAPAGCPAFLHRILINYDGEYRKQALEVMHSTQRLQLQRNDSSDTDAFSTHSRSASERRPPTPGSSSSSGTSYNYNNMSASTSTLGGGGGGGAQAQRQRKQAQSQPPPPLLMRQSSSFPFLEPLIPPENFAMINSNVYRSSLPLKKHFPFLRTLGLRSVLTLILEEYPSSNTTFLEENGIQFFQFGIPGNKEPFVQIPEDMISNALIAILDVRNHPMLIHCNKGKHRTGCLIGCLRKLQQWSLTTIFDEYRRFSAPKSRSMDQEFIELYAGEEEVWARVEPRWVPEWAGLPWTGNLYSSASSDEDVEEEEGEYLSSSASSSSTTTSDGYHQERRMRDLRDEALADGSTTFGARGARDTTFGNEGADMFMGSDQLRSAARDPSRGRQRHVQYDDTE